MSRRASRAKTIPVKMVEDRITAAQDNLWDVHAVLETLATGIEQGVSMDLNQLHTLYRSVNLCSKSLARQIDGLYSVYKDVAK
jgi:hypothetical protein